MRATRALLKKAVEHLRYQAAKPGPGFEMALFHFAKMICQFEAADALLESADTELHKSIALVHSTQVAHSIVSKLTLFPMDYGFKNKAEIFSFLKDEKYEAFWSKNEKTAGLPANVRSILCLICFGYFRGLVLPSTDSQGPGLYGS